MNQPDLPDDDDDLAPEASTSCEDLCMVECVGACGVLADLAPDCWRCGHPEKDHVPRCRCGCDHYGNPRQTS